MFELINGIVKDGKLHLTARRGVITLLEKVGKDPLDPDSWRPISLLCSDYKIFAKIIANRLQVVLPSIIHESQTGFMKNRHLSENTLKLLSLIHYTEQMKKSAIVVSFDFRKAFDRIRWEAIYSTMLAMNFDPKFVDLVRILYTDIYSCVINNSFWGEWFQLERSTRQGCPASTMIFTIVVEALGIKIRNNVKIKGLEMFNFELKSVQYVDDIWVTLEPSSENLNNLLDEIEEFHKYSGLEVNYSKTVAIKFGPCRDTNAKYYTLRQLIWSDKPVKILGIWFLPGPKSIAGNEFRTKIKENRKFIPNLEK